MKITSPKRGRRSTKRIDLTDMRSLFADTKLWCAMGIVRAQGDDPHYEITDSDVLVEVVLEPRLIPVTARLTASAMRIPNVGDEVMVVIPEGQIDFLPTIIDWFAPQIATEQPPQPDRVLVVTPEFMVHDGEGNAFSLPTLADFNNLKATVAELVAKYNGHTHTVATTGTATSQTGTAAAPVTADQGAAPSDPNGTQVLKAK